MLLLLLLCIILIISGAMEVTQVSCVALNMTTAKALYISHPERFLFQQSSVSIIILGVVYEMDLPNKMNSIELNALDLPGEFIFMLSTNWNCPVN